MWARCQCRHLQRGLGWSRTQTGQNLSYRRDLGTDWSMEWGYQLNQTENHEYYLILNCEWHVVERLSAKENQRLHLRRGDWGRPQLAGRGQKIYQVASDLRRTQYVLGRGKKSASHSWGKSQ